MISTGDLKKGLTIEFEGQLCSILDWQHVKMGRGGAIVTYQYQDGDQYHFMDTSTYDDIVLTAGQLGDAKNYLVDNLELDLILFEGEPISVEPPEKVVLRVTYTEPGFRGDTATGASKPATTETGLVVQVPLFVSTGDLIRINTTTGAYVERA